MKNNLMKAWVVREERHGEPIKAMALEEISIPEPGPDQVVVKVKSAGINYNHIWACLGKPLPLSKLHPGVEHHIGGSDVSGIVFKVGSNVKFWEPGHEVIASMGFYCGHCTGCTGPDYSYCRKPTAWGYETSYGSFGEYTLLKKEQLHHKPKHLTWNQAGSFGLKFFTVYRMLMINSEMKPGDVVLIWGAAGGIGSYAVKLCLAIGAIPIAVVSTEEKRKYVESLGCQMIINRKQFSHIVPDNQKNMELNGMKAFLKEIYKMTGGKRPDIVFEHSGQATFPTSVFVAERFGKIVICAGTSGYQLQLDARNLWMNEKRIIGSHGAWPEDCALAMKMMHLNQIEPTLTRTFSFDECAEANQEILLNKHMGSWVIDFEK